MGSKYLFSRLRRSLCPDSDRATENTAGSSHWRDRRFISTNGNPVPFAGKTK